MVLKAKTDETLYHGQCHCGFVKFEVYAAIDHIRECNCSICSMRGALMVRVPEKALTLHTPLSDLRLYQWGTMTSRDYFCPTCGILPFRRPRTLTQEEQLKGYKSFEGWAINARCLTDFDPTSVQIQNVNGKSLPLP